MRYRLCGACLNFAHPTEARCPFCGASLPATSRWAVRARTGALAALGLAALGGCAKDSDPVVDAGAGGAQPDAGVGGLGGAYGPPADSGFTVDAAGGAQPDAGVGGIGGVYGPPADYGFAVDGAGGVQADVGVGGMVEAYGPPPPPGPDAGAGGMAGAYGPPPPWDAARVDAATDVGVGGMAEAYGPPPPPR